MMEITGRVTLPFTLSMWNLHIYGETIYTQVLQCYYAHVQTDRNRSIQMMKRFSDDAENYTLHTRTLMFETQKNVIFNSLVMRTIRILTPLVVVNRDYIPQLK